MKQFDREFRLIFLFLTYVLFSIQLNAQVLLEPSGEYNIGHHRLIWSDSSRQEIFSKKEGFRSRKVVADIWYPAVYNDIKTIPYMDTLGISRTYGDNGLQSFLGAHASDLVNSGKVKTHAHEDADFDSNLKSAPLIFFSHGMGMIPQLYTSQVEDLVSHGYVVVTLTHPYDAWLTAISDKESIPFETKRRTAAGKTEEQQISYENIRIEWWAKDIQFALDQLTKINNSTTIKLPFTAKLDLDKVGAFGHSAGGRAAALACQSDARIKSCANQDGVAMMQPFYLDENGRGMTQPFLLFERVTNHKPEEADAQSLGMTLKDLNLLISNLRQKKEDALGSTGGSYHILLNFESSNHMSFSDLPLLQAENDADVAIASEILQETCRYTREFFDLTLKNVDAPLYQGKLRLEYIDLVKEYPVTRNK